MYCSSCGAQLAEGSIYCGECGEKIVDIHKTEGTPLQGSNSSSAYMNYNSGNNMIDSPSTGFFVLSIFFPVVGLILWLVWRETLPIRARSCGKGAITGVIVWVIFWIIYSIGSVLYIRSLFY